MGWEVKTGPDDMLPPSDVFVALVVEFNLKRFASGVVDVTNKPGRIEDILFIMRSWLKMDTVEPSVFASVLSKCVFAESYLDSQCGAIHMKRLRNCDCSNGGMVKVTSEFCTAVKNLLFYLEHSRPRTVNLGSQIPTPPILFTDACQEGETVGVGAVLFIHHQVFFFGVRLSASSLDDMRKLGYKHFISTAEISLIPIAVSTFYSYLQNSNSIFCVDNESARAAMIRGWSSKAISTDLIFSSRCTMSQGRAGFWLERVPSFSNVADGPSRGDFRFVRSLGGTEVRINVPDQFPSQLRFEPFCTTSVRSGR